MPKTAEDKARFLRDPCEFQKHQLCRRLWSKQKEIIHAVETKPLVAVKGCHASGKTFAAAGLPLEAGRKTELALAELRALYEPYVNALASHLVFPLPAWARPLGPADNWRATAWK